MVKTRQLRKRRTGIRVRKKWVFRQFQLEHQNRTFFAQNECKNCSLRTFRVLFLKLAETPLFARFDVFAVSALRLESKYANPAVLKALRDGKSTTRCKFTIAHSGLLSRFLSADICRHVSSQRGVHSVVNMGGVVKTLRLSNSPSRSVFSTAGSLGSRLGNSVEKSEVPKRGRSKTRSDAETCKCA